jgi:hypothetical protein
MREVEEKRKRLRQQKPQKIGSFIGRHMIPVVLGPKKRHYVIDHHHLSLALHKEGLRDVLVTVVLDLSALDLPLAGLLSLQEGQATLSLPRDSQRASRRVPRTAECRDYPVDISPTDILARRQDGWVARPISGPPRAAWGRQWYTTV